MAYPSRDRRRKVGEGRGHMSLRASDYRGILSFLDDLETANDLDSFMTTSVGRLHDLVAADVITFHDVDFVYVRPAHPAVTEVRAYYEFPELPLPSDAEETEAACRDAYPLCWTTMVSRMYDASDPGPMRICRRSDRRCRASRRRRGSIHGSQPHGRTEQRAIGLPRDDGSS
jgi:hypothetical protein